MRTVPRYAVGAACSPWPRLRASFSRIFAFAASMRGPKDCFVHGAAFSRPVSAADRQVLFAMQLQSDLPNETDGAVGWTSPYHFGINLGPVVLMCENYRSELPWRLMRKCPYIVAGLRRAEFKEGWLES